MFYTKEKENNYKTNQNPKNLLKETIMFIILLLHIYIQHKHIYTDAGQNASTLWRMIYWTSFKQKLFKHYTTHTHTRTQKYEIYLFFGIYVIHMSSEYVQLKNALIRVGLQMLSFFYEPITFFASAILPI